MNEVYIKKTDLNSWISKYFPNKDLISFDDMIAVIEDLDSELEKMREDQLLEDMVNDYPNEERDREIEVLGI